MNTDKKIYKVDAVIRPEKLEELKEQERSRPKKP